MTRILLILGVLLWALPAGAQTQWFKNGSLDRPTQSVSSGGIVTFFANTDGTEAEADSYVLDVRNCENIDIVISDTGVGSATPDTGGVYQIQACTRPHEDATVNTEAERRLACVDVAGGSITAVGIIQGLGIGSGYLRVNLTGTTTDDSDPELWLKCNGPGGF
jgi:hypothetical protein